MNAANLSRIAALQIPADALREVLLIAADMEAEHEAALDARTYKRGLAATRQARKRERDSGQQELAFVAPEEVEMARSIPVPTVDDTISHISKSSISSDVCEGVTRESRETFPSLSSLSSSSPPHPPNNYSSSNSIPVDDDDKTREAFADQSLNERKPAPRLDSGDMTKTALDLADEFAAQAGFAEFRPPGWCGAALAIQRWLNAGCPVDIVRIAVETTLKRCKTRDSPQHFAYFNPEIARTWAQFKTPLPVVRPGQLEVIDGGKSQSGAGTRTRRFVNGRAVARTYGSANDALEDLRDQFAREAERLGAEPYIPTYLRGGTGQADDGCLQRG